MTTVLTRRLRVRQGCSVLGKDGETIYKGGSLLPLDHGLPKQWIDDAFKNKIIENAPSEAEDALVAAPNVTPPPPVGGTGSKDKEGAIDVRGADPNSFVASSGAGGITTTSTPVVPPSSGPGSGTPLSIWNLDPATLQTQSLDDLNMMILERDEKVEPFASIDEARAWLSQDFNKQ